MSDKYTDVVTQSWFSRIGKAIKGVLFGIVIIIVGVILLFWNEGRAVKTHKALAESQGIVISIHPREILPSMNGKLVHLSGEVTTEEILRDGIFPLSVNAVRLQRYVETFQWVEHSSSDETRMVGGETRTVTTYEYKKKWVTDVVDSSSFRNPDGHENPQTLMYDSETWTAHPITIGLCELSNDYTHLISNFEPYPVESISGLPEGVSLYSDGLYYGIDPREPRIGDQRISFRIVKSQPYSVIGDLVDQRIIPHTATNGRAVALIEPGIHTSEDMFASAINGNANLTWLVRLGGTLLLIAGFGAILRPLSVIFDVIPGLGNVVGSGLATVVVVLGCIVALVVISVAWVFYRPLLSISILLVVGFLVYFLKRSSIKKGS